MDVGNEDIAGAIYLSPAGRKSLAMILMLYKKVK